MNVQSRIAGYLRERNPTTEVTSIVVLAGGSSAQTVLVDVDWVREGAKESRGLIFKIHSEAGALGEGADQEFEYRVLEALMPEDVATPNVYWCERDPGILGGPFYVMDQVEGSASCSELRKDERLRVETSRQLVRQMALLHRVDVSSGRFAFMPMPKTGEDCALNEVRRWADLYHKTTRAPEPGWEVVIGWLMEHAPETVERKALVWSDPGPSNFMYSETGEVTGLIDWELAHIGDPQEDVALLLNKLITSEKMMSKEELFDFYEEYAGVRVDERKIAYYMCLMCLRMAFISANSANQFSADPAAIFTGYTATLFPTLELVKAFYAIHDFERGELCDSLK